MERFQGKSILIGKEPAQGRLLVAVSGVPQTAMVGAPGSVPACVSRCKPAENVGHARIDFAGDGSMVITNLKPQNVTYVNGNPVESRHISPGSAVELGCDRFKVSIATVLEAAKKLVPAPAKKFNVRHLEQVWNDFRAQRKEVTAHNKNVNVVRTGCTVFTIGGGLVGALIAPPAALVCSGIGVAGILYSMLKLKNDDTTERLENITEEFQGRYVCPNPDCGRFLGNMSYRLMLRQYKMKCPYCGSQFVD